MDSAEVEPHVAGTSAAAEPGKEAHEDALAEAMQGVVAVVDDSETVASIQRAINAGEASSTESASTLASAADDEDEVDGLAARLASRIIESAVAELHAEEEAAAAAEAVAAETTATDMPTDELAETEEEKLAASRVDSMAVAGYAASEEPIPPPSGLQRESGVQSSLASPPLASPASLAAAAAAWPPSPVHAGSSTPAWLSSAGFFDEAEPTAVQSEQLEHLLTELEQERLVVTEQAEKLSRLSLELEQAKAVVDASAKVSAAVEVAVRAMKLMAAARERAAVLAVVAGEKLEVAGQLVGQLAVAAGTQVGSATKVAVENALVVAEGGARRAQLFSTAAGNKAAEVGKVASEQTVRAALATHRAAKATGDHVVMVAQSASHRAQAAASATAAAVVVAGTATKQGAQFLATTASTKAAEAASATAAAAVAAGTATKEGMVSLAQASAQKLAEARQAIWELAEQRKKLAELSVAAAKAIGGVLVAGGMAAAAGCVAAGQGAKVVGQGLVGGVVFTGGKIRDAAVACGDGTAALAAATRERLQILAQEIPRATGECIHGCVHPCVVGLRRCLDNLDRPPDATFGEGTAYRSPARGRR